MGEEKQGDGCLQHGSHPGGAACLLFDHLLGSSSEMTKCVNYDSRYWSHWHVIITDCCDVDEGKETGNFGMRIFLYNKRKNESWTFVSV